MSIIDQASAESSRRYNADTTIPEASRWRRDTRAAFMDGVQWLLAQLTDPDPETVDAFAIAMFEGRGNRLKWDRHADDPTQEHWRRIARDAIAALTNHLNGDQRCEAIPAPNATIPSRTTAPTNAATPGKPEARPSWASPPSPSGAPATDTNHLSGADHE